MKSHHIAIGGIDGSGKTTQAKKLHKHLADLGHSTKIISVLSREEKEVLNKLLERFDEFATTLFYEALHRQKFVETQKALKEHSVVITDRWSEAFDVHHGLHGSLKDKNLLRTILKEVSFENKMPDLGILIDIDPKVAMARMTARGMDHFDKQDLHYFCSIREGLLKYARVNKWLIIDGHLEEQAIHNAITAHVLSFLKDSNR